MDVGVVGEGGTESFIPALDSGLFPLTSGLFSVLWENQRSTGSWGVDEEVASHECANVSSVPKARRASLVMLGTILSENFLIAKQVPVRVREEIVGVERILALMRVPNGVLHLW